MTEIVQGESVPVHDCVIPTDADPKRSRELAATIRAELRQRLIDKGVTPKRADVLLKLADQKREGM